MTNVQEELAQALASDMHQAMTNAGLGMIRTRDECLDFAREAVAGLDENPDSLPDAHPTSIMMRTLWGNQWKREEHERNG